MIIAIDGPAAAGKGTLARRIAEHLGFAYLDTGLLYRATGQSVLRRGGNPDDPALAERAANSLSAADLDDPELRSEAVAQAASRVAAIAAVRTALLGFQRSFAADPPAGAKGAVLDGRDIGTVVCPGADLKFFVTASLDARAVRRQKELRDKGVVRIYTRVLQDMKDRDARDSERDVAPLARAGDAIMLDTTELDADAAFEAMLGYITSSGSKGGE